MRILIFFILHNNFFIHITIIFKTFTQPPSHTSTKIIIKKWIKYAFLWLVNLNKIYIIVGPRGLQSGPKLYLGPGPVPRRYLTEDEWSVAEVARGTAEDLPCPRHSRASMGRPTPWCRQSPNSPLKGMWTEWGP